MDDSHANPRAMSNDSDTDLRPARTAVVGPPDAGHRPGAGGSAPEPAIVPLGRVPHLAPILAEWHFRQWGWMNPKKDVRRRIALFRRHTHTGQVPTTFVALVEDRPVGSASLVGSDMETRPELGPWLASVYVDPPFRRRGIAGRLVDRVVREASLIGVERLYLFTPDQMRLYASLGWTELERVEYRGELQTIMSIDPDRRVWQLRNRRATEPPDIAATPARKE